MRKIKHVFLIIICALLITSLTGCNLFGLNEVEDNDLEIEKSAVEENMKALANNDGFEISYKVETSDTEENIVYCTFGASKGYTWFYNGDKETGVALEKYNDMTLFYTLSNGEWEYKYAYTGSTGEYGYDLTEVYGIFFKAYDLDGNLKKTGTKEIAGRKCDVYEYGVSNLVGSGAKWQYCIDQQTGICLKFEAEGKGTDGYSKSNYEVTSFKLSPSLPELRRPMDVYPINGDDPNKTGKWNYLAFVNLKGILPNESLFVSNEEYHSNEHLAIGQATYYYKLENIISFEDIQDYMNTYYSLVLSTIKEASDDHKCYDGEKDELEEASNELSDGSIAFMFIFLYHEEYYQISFFVEEVDMDDASFLLEISVAKIIE